MQTAIASVEGTYWQWQDHAIYYVHAGPKPSAKPPLLLVHGFGASTDHWRKNIQDLQQDFDVWAIDLLGFGRSAKPDLQLEAGHCPHDETPQQVNSIIRNWVQDIVCQH